MSEKYTPRKPSPRVLEVRLWFDVTGGGAFSRNRLDRIIKTVLEESVGAVEEAGLTVRAIGGDWAAYYPISAGNIDRPGRQHETGA
jgi:hypothetical protein